MAKKLMKATNKKSNKNNDIITDDVIAMVNENHKRQEWETEEKRKQAKKKAVRRKAWKKHERKENIMFLTIMLALLLIAGLVENIPFTSHYLNMEKVVDYTVTEEGLMLHTDDGSGYWLEN